MQNVKMQGKNQKFFILLCDFGLLSLIFNFEQEEI